MRYNHIDDVADARRCEVGSTEAETSPTRWSLAESRLSREHSESCHAIFLERFWIESVILFIT